MASDFSNDSSFYMLSFAHRRMALSFTLKQKKQNFKAAEYLF